MRWFGRVAKTHSWLTTVHLGILPNRSPSSVSPLESSLLRFLVSSSPLELCFSICANTNTVQIHTHTHTHKHTLTSLNPVPKADEAPNSINCQVRKQHPTSLIMNVGLKPKHHLFQHWTYWTHIQIMNHEQSLVPPARRRSQRLSETEVRPTSHARLQLTAFCCGIQLNDFLMTAHTGMLSWFNSVAMLCRVNTAIRDCNWKWANSENIWKNIFH